MKRLIPLSYLIFILIITIYSILDDLKITGYPSWMLISGIVIPLMGIVSVLLYVLSYKPKLFSWIWKVVPFALVCYYLAEWYFDFVVFKKSDDTPQLLVTATLLGSLVLFPLLFCSFKLGYHEKPH